jgi:hypothetical protein
VEIIVELKLELEQLMLKKKQLKKPLLQKQRMTN